MQAFLDLARKGKNDWWRYLLAVSLILFLWQVIGAIPALILFAWENPTNGGEVVSSFTGMVGTLPGFIAIMLASVFFFFGIYLAIRFIHRRPLLTLITPHRSFFWKRFFQGFGVWFFLAVLMSAVEAFLYRGRYVWNPDLHRFIPFFLCAIVLIPLQTSAEELFFRSYLIQGFGLRLRNIWALSAISGLLFGIPHLLNPEASASYPLLGLNYIAFGFSLAYITLRDGRLELALGMHAANNLFTVLIANYSVTVLPSPSLFTISFLDPVYSVLAALIGLIVFVWLFSVPLYEDGLKNPNEPTLH